MKLPTLDFRFRFMRDAHTLGFFSLRGRADDEGLWLGRLRLPYDSVRTASVRDRRLILGLQPGAALGKFENYRSPGNYVVLEIQRVEPLELERRVEGRISAREAEARRQTLEAAGRGHLFRAEPCPECGATVDLSELPQTRYRLCPYCETVFAAGGAVLTPGSSYRFCSECGLFGRVKRYTELTFRILIVSNGFEHHERHLCSRCAGRIFWKLLAVNLPFLVGLPRTLAMGFRSRFGRDPRLLRLDRANALALRGRWRDAEPLFRAMRAEFPDHPSLIHNEAVGHLKGDDQTGALALLHLASDACANHQPSLALFRRLADTVDVTEGVLEEVPPCPGSSCS